MLWYGERSANENETEDAVGGILGEVAIRSGGEIIHIVSTEHGQHIAGNTVKSTNDRTSVISVIKIMMELSKQPAASR